MSDTLRRALNEALDTLESIYSGEYSREDAQTLAGDEAAEVRGVLGLNDAEPPIERDRWAQHSSAFQAEKPWCGWTLAFSHGSDWDTTEFGLKRLVGITILLTTADGRSRSVEMTDWQHIEEAACPSCGCQSGPVIPNGSADAACPQCGEDWPEDGDKAGIMVHELETEKYKPREDMQPELVRYEDIREIVVY